MYATSWVVNIGGLLLIGLIVLYFWGPKKGGSLASVNASGLQEAVILVKNGYTPSRIVVQSGKPVRFQFNREEKNPCSEMVVFPDFQKSSMLPVGKKVSIDLPPMTEGTYEFTCQMGMYRGSIIVKGEK